MPKKSTHKPRWEFLWGWDREPRRTMHARVYVAPTIEQACDKMLNWIYGRDFDVIVDYEARAEHVRYNASRHEVKYPNLLEIDHPIREHV